MGARLFIGLPLKEFCQLPHFPHQGQEEVPRLVELAPVSFSSKLSMEAAAGIEERSGGPGGGFENPREDAKRRRASR